MDPVASWGTPVYSHSRWKNKNRGKPRSKPIKIIFIAHRTKYTNHTPISQLPLPLESLLATPGTRAPPIVFGAKARPPPYSLPPLHASHKKYQHAPDYFSLSCVRACVSHTAHAPQINAGIGRGCEDITGWRREHMRAAVVGVDRCECASWWSTRAAFERAGRAAASVPHGVPCRLVCSRSSTPARARASSCSCERGLRDSYTRSCACGLVLCARVRGSVRWRRRWGTRPRMLACLRCSAGCCSEVGWFDALLHHVRFCCDCAMHSCIRGNEGRG